MDFSHALSGDEDHRLLMIFGAADAPLSAKHVGTMSGHDSSPLFIHGTSGVVDEVEDILGGPRFQILVDPVAGHISGRAVGEDRSAGRFLLHGCFKPGDDLGVFPVVIDCDPVEDGFHAFFSDHAVEGHK